MKLLVISNTCEFNRSLERYLSYSIFPRTEIFTYSFGDLRIIPREILEADFIITEVYRFSENSIDDYGLDMFLNFLRREKKGILLHIDRIENSGLRIKKLLFKVPGMMRELVEKLESLKIKEKITLSQEDIEKLKECFPYRVVKGHNSHRHYEDSHR